MILTKKALSRGLKNGMITIEPFFDSIGANSIDLHLGKTLAVYKDEVLDCARDNKVQPIDIPNTGLVLYPGVLYLGNTIEHTSSSAYIPLLEGKSSLGRLGLQVHITAGVGDLGFSGTWTLEMTVVHPLRIYAGMPVAQLMYYYPSDLDSETYAELKSSKYNNQPSHPCPSKMYMNFPLKEEVIKYLKDR